MSEQPSLATLLMRYGRPEPVDVAGSPFQEQQSALAKFLMGQKTGPDVRDPQTMGHDWPIINGGGTFQKPSDMMWAEATATPGQRRAQEILGSDQAQKVMTMAQFLGPKLALPKWHPTRAMAADILRQVRRNQYDAYGVRVTEEPLPVGSRPAPSRVWDDGVPTDDTLPGASLLHVDPKVDSGPGSLLYALRQIGARAPMKGEKSPYQGHYFGDDVSLVGTNRYQRGVDPAELIELDGKVLKAWKKPWGPGADR